MLLNEKANLNFTEKHSVTDGQANTITFNFKEIVEEQKSANSGRDQESRRAANAFKNMKITSTLELRR